MTGFETTTCMVCNRGIVVFPIGDTFKKLVDEYGSAKEIPEARRIAACKAGEEACLIEARYYEKVARKARKVAATYKFMQKKGITFGDV